MDILHNMTEALMMYETLDAAQINELMNRKAVTPPKDYTPPKKTTKKKDKDLKAGSKGIDKEQCSMESEG